MKQSTAVGLSTMRDGLDEPKNNILRVDFEKNALNQEQKLLGEKKRELFEEWLKNGIVTVLLDARANGVVVPDEFRKDGDLRLNFSYNYHIPDFNFDNTAVWATLAFEDGSSYCRVPWKSVYGIQSAVLNQGAVWFGDFPADYDQAEVLGVSEQSIEEETEEMPECNVIEYDFTSKKDLVK